MRKRNLPEFDLAIIDADSMMYYIAWDTINQKTAEKALMNRVAEIITSVDVPDAYVYIKGIDNFRFSVDPQYKAHRGKTMDPEVADRVELLYSFARKNFIESHLGEADDYACIHSYNALAEGKIPVVCHIDKDLNMIPGWHYNFKKKDMYYVSPEESFTFMCRQLLSGDMSSDNIPGIKGVGDLTAARMLHNFRLSQMKDEIIQQWCYGKKKPNSGESSPEDRYERFLKSANCLILRETVDELRELTEEEILDKMTWKNPETDYIFHHSNDVSDEMLANSFPITSYMPTKRAARCSKTTDTGTTTPGIETETQTTTSGSSTE